MRSKRTQTPVLPPQSPALLGGVVGTPSAAPCGLAYQRYATARPSPHPAHPQHRRTGRYFGSAALATALCTTALLFVCAPAYAQWDKDIDLGVHAMGYFGGNFLTEPGDKIVEDDRNRRFEAIYPGFGGTGQGGGLALDFRYAGIIGLELGVLFTSEEAKGEVNDLNLTLSHSTTHVPVMIKVAAPTELIRPYAMIGWQFSFVSDSKADFEGGSGTFSAKDEDYSSLAFGFGFEIALPIEGVDLRIPISIRGAWNTSITDKAADRGDYDLDRNHITYSTAFEYHAAGTLGLAWYFL